MRAEELKEHIRDIPDFPKPGILFRDITPLLLDPKAYRQTVDILRNRYEDQKIDKIVAVESRGFLFASPIAYQLGAGFIPLRKPGKLPYETIKESYALEYGEAALEIHKDAIQQGDRVLILDDLLATGGTAAAAVSLVKRLGGEVVEVCFLIELKPLGGRCKLNGTPVFSLLSYD
ncbi:MAG: adenine phosphoribosyltransferase [Candidatus Latescibacterota bacterium]|nr:MAG: adenine phosphoribosyltransferase [Candidatus Latescibacterota bacterium]